MRPIIILSACLLAVAQARPEAGYSYPNPSGPGYQVQQSFSLGNNLGQGNQQSFNFGSSNQGLNLASNTLQSLEQTSFGQNSGASFGQNLASSFGQSTGFSSGSVNTHFSAQQNSAPVVHKHAHVHVAPQEPQVHSHQQIQVAAPQKHHKIIFIKAPTAPTPTAPVIPAQQQNEEKTPVYVLVKKAEKAPQVHIPTPAPTQPSKPEVYFIKYKNQQQAEQAISNVNNGQGVSLGGSASSLGLSGLNSGSLSGLSGVSSIGSGSSLNLNSGSFNFGSSSSSGAAPVYGVPS